MKMQDIKKIERSSMVDSVYNLLANIKLYKGSELIDQTDILKDDKNDDYTWSFCDEGWKFDKSTKAKENDCVKILIS